MHKQVDFSTCGQAILISMVQDAQKRIVELEEERELIVSEKVVSEDVRDAIIHLFLSIGSWTNSRWDQHLRHEFGDEKTDSIISWLIAEGILYERPKDAWAGFEPEGSSVPPVGSND